MTDHTVTYVLDDCSTIDKLVARISPDRLRTSCPERSRYVVRFGPRSKRWEVYDIRRYVPGYKVHPGRSTSFYFAPPPSFVTEERERAIAYAQVIS